MVKDSGIRELQEYSGNLSEDVIRGIIETYDYNHLIVKEVERNQVSTLIRYGIHGKEKQMEYKFYYMDSLVIIHRFDIPLIQMLQKNYDFEYDFEQVNFLFNNRIQISAQPDAYWTNEGRNNSYTQRELVINREVHGNVYLEYRKENDYVIIIEYKRSKIEIPFQMKNWNFNKYDTKEFEEKLRNLIGGVKQRIEYKQMTFSFLYLDGYRKLKEQVIDLDHRYCMDIENRKITDCTDKREIEHFYGKNVASLTCIVGKNGTGKTSSVHFLKERFFQILQAAREYGMKEETNGMLGEQMCKHYALLEKEEKFFIIFRMDDDDYFLTNMSDVDWRETKKLRPFSAEKVQSSHEFAKIAYFSQQLQGGLPGTRLWNADNPNRLSREREQSARREVAIDRVLYDFSEESSVTRSNNIFMAGKQRAMMEKEVTETEEINWELLYQLGYMQKMGEIALREEYDSAFREDFYLCDLRDGRTIEQMAYEEFFDDEERMEEGWRDDFCYETHLREYWRNPWVRVGRLSSGQYAKFSFLSRLNWFLDPELKEETERILKQELLGSPVLEKDETVVLFIDEGDAYYHPEWQRQYLSTLLTIINQRFDNAKVQIILTTNSPFMLSDLLAEDIVYLSSAEKQECFKADQGTFGQNIHTLLMDNFYMENTIGNYSKNLIIEIEKFFASKGEQKQFLGKYYKDTDNPDQKIEKLISLISEPVYRTILEDQLQEWRERNPDAKEQLIRQMEKEREELDRKIKRLKGNEEE